MRYLARFYCVIFIGCSSTLISSSYVVGGDFVFGFPNNGGKVFWGPETNKLPVALESPIREANLTILLKWIDLAHQLRENFVKMKERACSNGMCSFKMPDAEQDYDMDPMDPQPMNLEQQAANLMKNPPPEFIPKIDEAIQKIDTYETRLLQELRKPEKDWNYSAESSTSAS